MGRARHTLHLCRALTPPAEPQQDSLAEGMHLIDFEQLKMENVTLREKIEECGDEVARLRKKTNATVQARLYIVIKVCDAMETMGH